MIPWSFIIYTLFNDQQKRILFAQSTANNFAEPTLSMDAILVERPMDFP